MLHEKNKRTSDNLCVVRALIWFNPQGLAIKKNNKKQSRGSRVAKNELAEWRRGSRAIDLRPKNNLPDFLAIDLPLKK